MGIKIIPIGFMGKLHPPRDDIAGGLFVTNKDIKPQHANLPLSSRFKILKEVSAKEAKDGSLIKYKKMQEGEYNYMGNAGDKVVIEKTGKGDFTAYHLTNAETIAMINMTFDSEEEAKKYADKRGLIVVEKFIDNLESGGEAGIIANPKLIKDATVREYLGLAGNTKVEIKSGERTSEDVNYTGYTVITITPNGSELSGKLDELIKKANAVKGGFIYLSNAKPNFGGGITWVLHYNYFSFADENGKLPDESFDKLAEGGLVGKFVTIDLPNYPGSFKTLVSDDTGDVVITPRGVFSKRYIVENKKQEDSSLVNKMVQIKLPNATEPFSARVVVDDGSFVITSEGVFSKEFIVPDKKEGGGSFDKTDYTNVVVDNYGKEDVWHPGEFEQRGNTIFKVGGDIEKSMLYHLANRVSNIEVGKITKLARRSEVEGVRSAAFSILMRDGDQKYSEANLKKLLHEAKDEYAEHKHGASFAYAEGGEVEKFDKRVLLGYNEYCNAIFNSTEGGLKIDAENDLARYIEMQKDLRDGNIKPAKVVGGGYKNGRKVANEWIEDQIERVNKILATNGKSNSTIQGNFIHHVLLAKNQGAISKEDAARLMYDIGKYLSEGRRKEVEYVLGNKSLSDGGKIDAPFENRQLNAMYKQYLDFAELLRPDQLEGLTKEAYAKKEAIEWGVRMNKLKAKEANEMLVDVSTGKVVGKRKDVERQNEIFAVGGGINNVLVRRLIEVEKKRLKELAATNKAAAIAEIGSDLSDAAINRFATNKIQGMADEQSRVFGFENGGFVDTDESRSKLWEELMRLDKFKELPHMDWAASVFDTVLGLMERDNSVPLAKMLDEAIKIEIPQSENYVKTTTNREIKQRVQDWLDKMNGIERVVDENAVIAMQKKIDGLKDYLKNGKPHNNNYTAVLNDISKYEKELSELKRGEVKLSEGGDLSKYKVFAVFNGANVILHKDFKLLPDRYIQVAGNEPIPVEDYGDWMLFETDVTEDEAFDEFLKVLEAGGTVESRIDSMLASWTKDGRAFSKLANDDTEFFAKVGVPYEKLGITSQIGSDIVYYDTNVYAGDSEALRKHKISDGPTLTYAEMAAMVPKLGDTVIVNAGRFVDAEAKVIDMGIGGNNYKVEFPEGVKAIIMAADVKKKQQLKVGDYVWLDTDYGKHYGQIQHDYTDEKFYVADKNGFQIEGIGDPVEPHRLHKTTKEEYEKYKLAAGGSVEKIRTKNAKKDIALCKKDGSMAITDTKHGVLWLEYKDGIFTIRLNDGKPPLYQGDEAGAFKFVAAAYVIDGDAPKFKVGDHVFINDIDHPLWSSSAYVTKVIGENCAVKLDTIRSNALLTGKWHLDDKVVFHASALQLLPKKSQK